MMGAIASPALQVSPMHCVSALWSGTLPEFQSKAEAEELFSALVAGLWNRLAAHQDSRTPFRLLRSERPDESRSGLLQQASTRRSELAGFVDGLFGAQATMSFPDKAHEALSRLGELHAMLDGIAELLADETKPAGARELKELARNMQQMTLVAEKLINTTIQSCKRMRAQQLQAMTTAPMQRPSFAQHDDQPELIESALSQRVTRHGVTVQVEIYGDGEGRWILEVIDAQGTSIVWDEHFETDQDALDEAIASLESNPIEFSGNAPADGSDPH
jgi:hypothetical protein